VVFNIDSCNQPFELVIRDWQLALAEKARKINEELQSTTNEIEQIEDRLSRLKTLTIHLEADQRRIKEAQSGIYSAWLGLIRCDVVAGEQVKAQ